MRQDVEAFKVINIGIKGSEKEDECWVGVMSKSTQPFQKIPSHSA